MGQARLLITQPYNKTITLIGRVSVILELKTLKMYITFFHVFLCSFDDHTDTTRAANEAWVSRQNLQDLYQRLLVMDLEYALDKKVEQDL